MVSFSGSSANAAFPKDPVIGSKVPSWRGHYGSSHWAFSQRELLVGVAVTWCFCSSFNLTFFILNGVIFYSLFHQRCGRRVDPRSGKKEFYTQFCGVSRVFGIKNKFLVKINAVHSAQSLPVSRGNGDHTGGSMDLFTSSCWVQRKTLLVDKSGYLLRH